MTTARYTITSGLAGCYLPNSASAPQAYHSRRELADAIRAEIEYQSFPKSAFAQAQVRNLWRKIVHVDSASSMHFSIEHGAYEIAFHGMTQEEFDAAEAQGEWS